MDNEELDKLEIEIKKTFLESQQNIQNNCAEVIRKQVLILSADVINNSLRMVKETRCRNEHCSR